MCTRHPPPCCRGLQWEPTLFHDKSRRRRRSGKTRASMTVYILLPVTSEERSLLGGSQT